MPQFSSLQLVFSKAKLVIGYTVKPAYVVTCSKGSPVLSTFSVSLKLKYSANEPVLRVMCLKQPLFVLPLGDPLRQV